MTLRGKLLIFILIALAVYGGLSLAVDTKNSILSDKSEDHVRVFCLQNRLYIEFTRSSGAWGVAALDSEGRPIRCPKRNNVEGQPYEIENGV